MAKDVKRLKRQRTIIWLYVWVVPAWVLVTDGVYEEWVNQLSISEVIFSAVRSGVLYAITAWILLRLTERLMKLEMRFRTMIEHSPQPLFIMKDEKWVYANPRGLQLTGTSHPDDLVGQSVWELVQTDERESLGKSLSSLSTSESAVEVHGDGHLVRRDGQLIDVQFLAAPIDFEDDPAVQILFTDVTRANQMKRTLHATLKELESFVENNVDAIAIFGEDSRLTKVNSAFEDMFGCLRSECVGRPFQEVGAAIIPEEYREEAQQLMAAILSGETIKGHQTVRMTTSGEKIEVSLTVFPIRDENGHIKGWSVTFRDLSEQRAAEKRLLQSEKLVAVGQLAAGVAHEIRNPLATVLGLMQLLPDSVREKQLEYIPIMRAELQRITGIVSEMLTLAKPHVTEFTMLDLGEVLSDVRHLLEAEAALRQVNFSVDLSDLVESPTNIRGNKDRLKQVVINLVRNAMDALPDSNRNVSIEASRSNMQVTIRVTDTGIGLSKEQLERLGEPFFTTKESGTGLGLHVCRQIVGEHQGEMWFESKVGHGTTVTIALPILSS